MSTQQKWIVDTICLQAIVNFLFSSEKYVEDLEIAFSDIERSFVLKQKFAIKPGMWKILM